MKIEWCIKQNKGIKKIKPNPNLAEAYIDKAEKALISIDYNKFPEWKIATAYYALYFSLYAILIRTGIKCEIHTCTIEFAKQYLQRYIDKEEITFLNKALKLRKDSQYYVDKTVTEKEIKKLKTKTPEFYAKCKNITENMTSKEIRKINEEIKK